MVSNWAPAPFVEIDPQHKLYGSGPAIGATRRRGGHVAVHDEYRLTRSARFLGAPFQAMELARRGNDCALALLSAARSLYLAERVPNELERTERIMLVWRAREALSEPGRRGKGKARERWARLLVNLGLRRELVNSGYELREIEEALTATESLRDLVTHFPDDVLVNLSYPVARRRTLKKGRVVGADPLALALVSADWPILRVAVRSASRRLARAAIKNGWDDRWFHRQFV